MTTGTGWLSRSRAGRNTHWRAAFMACSSRPYRRSRDLVTRTSVTAPDASTIASSRTLPWIFASMAALVYEGCTSRITVGGRTPAPPRGMSPPKPYSLPGPTPVPAPGPRPGPDPPPPSVASDVTLVPAACATASGDVTIGAVRVGTGGSGIGVGTTTTDGGWGVAGTASIFGG